MRSLIIFCLTLTCFSTFGQQRILDSLNLDSGSYKFYFIKQLDLEGEVEPLPQARQYTSKVGFEVEIDSAGNFLIADQQELLSLKSSWQGVAVDEILLCSYDYFMYVVKDNRIEQELRVNTRCGQVVADFGVFNFEGNPFDQLKNRIPVWVMSSRHKTIRAGREFISTLDPNIILSEKKEWVEFDGHFQVDRPGGKNAIREFEQLMQETYPKDGYKLKLAGAGPNSISFNVYSDSIFYQNFKFERKGKWHLEKPSRISYFTEETDMIKELLK